MVNNPESIKYFVIYAVLDRKIGEKTKIAIPSEYLMQ
jgi:hypothetical protein